VVVTRSYDLRIHFGNSRIEQQQQEMLALARTFLRWTGCLPRTE
jgi:hypothetical protein